MKNKNIYALLEDTVMRQGLCFVRETYRLLNTCPVLTSWEVSLHNYKLHSKRRSCYCALLGGLWNVASLFDSFQVTGFWTKGWTLMAVFLACGPQGIPMAVRSHSHLSHSGCISILPIPRGCCHWEKVKWALSGPGMWPACHHLPRRNRRTQRWEDFSWWEWAGALSHKPEELLMLFKTQPK